MSRVTEGCLNSCNELGIAMELRVGGAESPGSWSLTINSQMKQLITEQISAAIVPVSVRRRTV